MMSTPGSAITLVTFDVGGTLLTLRPDLAQAYAEILAEAGCSVNVACLAAALDDEWEAAARRRAESVPADHRVSILAGEQRRHAFVVNVLRNAGVPEPDVEHCSVAVRTALDSARMYAVYEETIPTRRGLWERGLRLGVIANTWPSMPRILLEFGLGEYVGFWVVSEFVGVEKPPPAIFEMALEVGSAQPAQAIHVGDDYTRDVAGAQSAGMQAVLVDRGCDQYRVIPADVAVIHRLDDLLDIIIRIRAWSSSIPRDARGVGG